MTDPQRSAPKNRLIIRPTRPPKGDKAYKRLWAVVDGAVRALHRDHPEYFTDAGRQAAAMSLNKRVVGAVMGYLAGRRLKELGLEDGRDTAIALASAALDLLKDQAEVSGRDMDIDRLIKAHEAFVQALQAPVIVEIKKRRRLAFEQETTLDLPKASQPQLPTGPTNLVHLAGGENIEQMPLSVLNLPKLQTQRLRQAVFGALVDAKNHRCPLNEEGVVVAHLLATSQSQLLKQPHLGIRTIEKVNEALGVFGKALTVSAATKRKTRTKSAEDQKRSA